MIDLYLADGRVRIRLRAFFVGQDMCVIVDGGDRPHIGALSIAACGMATETLSLAGHKEDVLSQRIVESLQKCFKHTVTCLCGIHIADITKEEIQVVFKVVDSLVDELMDRILEKTEESA